MVPNDLKPTWAPSSDMFRQGYVNKFMIKEIGVRFSMTNVPDHLSVQVWVEHLQL